MKLLKISSENIFQYFAIFAERVLENNSEVNDICFQIDIHLLIVVVNRRLFNCEFP